MNAHRFPRKSAAAILALNSLGLLLAAVGAGPARGADGNRRVDLAGAWQVRLDPQGQGHDQRWFDSGLEGVPIELPGTTDRAGLGEPLDRETWTRERPLPSGKWPLAEAAADLRQRGYLIRETAWIGKAWYQRQMEIPPDWAGQHVELRLERCLWQSEVWVDGRRVGSSDSLVAEHRYDLGELTPGTHRLSLCIDNGMVHNINLYGHAYGPETQSRWNGVVGEIALTARPAVALADVAVFPAADGGSVRARIRIRGPGRGELHRRLTLQVLPEGGGDPLGTEAVPLALVFATGEVAIECEVKVEGPVVAWDEFHPIRYLLRARLEGVSGEAADADEVVVPFGFRHIERDGRAIRVNGRRIFLRGTLDCCVYPRTGHPPTAVADWLEVLGTIKDHGFNHVRYHSWCPPKAAFEAADRLGLYLAPETPLWIDNWITGAGTRSAAFGKDPEVVRFIREEVERMLRCYGNHPSFAFLGIGNEIGSAADWELLNQIIADAKVRDPRHLYTVCTARQTVAADDFWVTHHTGGHPTRGVGPAHTDWDFAGAVQSYDRPLVSHETGQRPVFPNYAEQLPKFTGPLKPYNLEMYRDKLEAAGMAELNAAFTRASGRFQLVQYKSEHEAMLRTAGLAGYQLLMLNDFTGQGEALVGVLDPFWESKGLVEAAELRRWCSPTVPLLRFAKYTWTSDETFSAEAHVAHFGPSDLEGGEALWKLSAGEEVVGAGTLATPRIPTGEVTALGRIEFDLARFEEAQALRLELALDGTDAINDWNLWVYPPAGEPPGPGAAVVARSYPEAEAALAAGKSVLLLAYGMDNDHTQREPFLSVYWSASWFPNTPGTLGILCDPQHPALADFPTEDHSDWQWRDLLEGATSFKLDAAPPDFRPIVQPVTDFHRCQNLGDLFEARVGPGRLLVCGFDLSANLERRPAARQMRRSLLRYLQSEDFRPSHRLDPELLERLLKPRAPAPEAADVRESLTRAALHVRAARLLSQLDANVPWTADSDEVVVSSASHGWQVARGGTWKDRDGAAWHGNPLQVTLEVPAGTRGRLFLHLHDWNGLGRRGTLVVEGSAWTVDAHDGDGRWYEFEISPQHTEDSRLEVSARASAGPNLMITEIAFVPR